MFNPTQLNSSGRKEGFAKEKIRRLHQTKRMREWVLGRRKHTCTFQNLRKLRITKLRPRNKDKASIQKLTVCWNNM